MNTAVAGVATAGRAGAERVPRRFGVREALLVGLAAAYPFHYYVPGLGGIVNVSLGDVIVGLTVAGFCASLLVGRWTPPRYLTPVTAFAAVALVSLIPSWARSTAAPAFFDPVPGLGEIVKLFGSAAWMVAVYILLRPDPLRGIRVFVWTSILMAATFALISIHDALLHPGVRQAGPFENENQYANYLALNVFLAVMAAGSAGEGGRAGAPALARAIVPLLLVAIVATGSRGGVVSFLAAVPFAVDWRNLARACAGRPLRAAAAACLCIAGVAAFWQANPLIAHRLLTVVSGQGPNIRSREYLWHMGVGAFLTSPVLGIGYHQFPQYAQTYFGWKSQVVHDTYLATAAELGVIGMLAYGWLLAVIFRDAWRFRREPVFGAVARLIVAVMVATLVQGLFDDVEHDRSLWISFGMLAAIGYALDAYGPGRLEARRTQRGPHSPPVAGRPAAGPACAPGATEVDA